MEQAQHTQAPETAPNTFIKYASGVYCMQSESAEYNHSDKATIETRHGKKVSVIVWKKLFSKAGHTYYSIVREDGFNRTEWTRRKMERAENAAARQERLSDEYYAKSNKDRDFLSLGEPIKVGHHSESRHRKAIEGANRNMGKCVEAIDRQKEYGRKADELEYRLKKEINLDTPESCELLEERVADLEARKTALKESGEYQSFELSNLGAKIRRYKKRLVTAKRLWELEDRGRKAKGGAS